MAENEPDLEEIEEPEEPEITTVEETRTESISYETIRRENSELEEGIENVIQEGVNGTLTITEEVTYTDGDETSREEISRETTTEPIEEIVEYGTMVIEVLEEVKTETVLYETERIPNENLEINSENIIQEGQYGERTITEEVTYENGDEVNRRVISDEITTEPVNEIIEYGTMEPTPEPETGDGDNNKNNRRKKNMSIVWRDKVLSSYNGNIESVMIYDSNNEKVEVPNGHFVRLEGLEGIGREVKKAVLADDATEEVLLVASPEVHYEGNKDLDDFVNEADRVARAFRLADGDVITLTEDLINEDNVSVGDTLTVGEGGKLVAQAEDAEAGTIQFVVREDARYELTRRQRAWRLDIVK